MTAASERVQTVVGPLPATELGHVQMHEHVLLDLWKGVPAGVSAADEARYLEPVSLQNYYWTRRYHSRDDLLLADHDVARDELTAYRGAGGSTLVDVTSIGLGRDPSALAELSRASGVNIVMGCGYYYADYHPRPITTSDLDAIRDEIVSDLTVGVGDTGVVAGIIGEIGLSWPHKEGELVVLSAAAQAHLATGVAISVHPARDARSPFAAIDHLVECGVDPKAIVMGHVERTLTNPADVRALAGTGCYVEFDLFGQESSFYSLAPAVHMPNDAGRADLMVDLIGRGHLDQLLISQDVCHKTNLTRWGGEGYTHILHNVMPLLAAKGLSDAQLATITRSNPRRVLVPGNGGAG